MGGIDRPFFVQGLQPDQLIPGIDRTLYIAINCLMATAVLAITMVGVPLLAASIAGHPVLPIAESWVPIGILGPICGIILSWRNGRPLARPDWGQLVAFRQALILLRRAHLALRTRIISWIPLQFLRVLVIFAMLFFVIGALLVFLGEVREGLEYMFIVSPFVIIAWLFMGAILWVMAALFWVPFWIIRELFTAPMEPGRARPLRQSIINHLVNIVGGMFIGAVTAVACLITLLALFAGLILLMNAIAPLFPFSTSTSRSPIDWTDYWHVNLWPLACFGAALGFIAAIFSWVQLGAIWVILAYRRSIPIRLQRFLTTVDRRKIMKKGGRGYVFLHGELQAYFARLADD
jgi:hypothetical protein